MTDTNTPYKAGTLDVEILGASDSAVVSIERTAKALRSLSNVLKKMENINFSFSAQKINALFSGIAKATNSVNAKNIEALALAGKSLSSISRIGNLEKVDFNKIGDGFTILSQKITPFLNQVRSAETSLTSLYGVIRKMGRKGFSSVGGGSSAGAGLFGMFNIAKFWSAYYIARRYGGIVQGIAQAGADYTETLNLWETSMRNNVTVATEFIEKMNRAYGISEKTLMNAQAVFKNMLGSLGQIDEATAYALSEGVTQMAVDYASLYNVTFEKAFEKFQAALAGQVRPIRSVSGYDITENTIYQLYQQLGGTKSVRNLSRTEKQLLSLLAIFNQMTRSGAIGDLEKTMESYANQSRLLAESWLRVKTYAGSLLTYTIQESGLLTRINAILIFIGDTLKAVAESMGAIQHFENDPFASLTDGAVGASEAIDEVTGKLLDFDKFRSLSGGEENVAIDQHLLDALTGFNSILSGATNEAQKLAKSLKETSGLFNEDGTFNKERWNEIIAEAKTFGKVLLTIASVIIARKVIGAVSSLQKSLIGLKETMSLKNLGITALVAFLFYAYATNEQFRESINDLVISLKPLFSAFSNVANALIPIVNIFVELISGIVTLLNKLGLLEGAVYLVVVAFVAWKSVKLLDFLGKMSGAIGTIATMLSTTLKNALASTAMAYTTASAAQKAFAIGIGAVGGAIAFVGLTKLMEDLRGTKKLIAGIITVLASATAAWVAYNTARSFGVGAAVMLASIGAGVAGVKAIFDSIQEFAVGASDIDSGTLFVAGEMGKTEAVFNGSNGKTNVANIQQMQSAFNGALNNWWSQAKHDIPQFREVSKTGIYEVAKGEMIGVGSGNL